MEGAVNSQRPSCRNHLLHPLFPIFFRVSCQMMQILLTSAKLICPKDQSGTGPVREEEKRRGQNDVGLEMARRARPLGRPQGFSKLSRRLPKRRGGATPTHCRCHETSRAAPPPGLRAGPPDPWELAPWPNT